MIGQEAAKRAALQHLAKTHPEWPNGTVQNLELKGSQYVVTIMPENKMGILAFFMTYRFWVNTTTGVVEKMQ
jgi:hypothetical protein